MYELFFTQQFQKKYKEIKEHDVVLVKKLKKSLPLLAQDPHYPSLHTHKVDSREFLNVWSSRVTGDVRIIWEYSNKVHVIDLIDIGTHSGGKKVYR